MGAKKAGLFAGLYGAVPPIATLLRAGEELPVPVVMTARLDDDRVLRVVRDDLLTGGTKLRVLLPLLACIGNKDVAYASPAYGYAQIALAEAARRTRKTAHIFVAARRVMHERTERAKELGAVIHGVPHGYLSVVQAYLREFCSRSGAFEVPFGCDFYGAEQLIAQAAGFLDATITPRQAWCVAGSGMLSRGLQRAWPLAAHHIIAVGKEPEVCGHPTMYRAPEKYEQNAKHPPPFPSCSNYDAKAWRFIEQDAIDGAVFWNVGA